MGIRCVLFDFDGVLAESNDARLRGFARLFEDAPPEVFARIMAFCRENAGISRYEKIRHYFEQLLGTPAEPGRVEAMAFRFSAIVIEAIVAAPAVRGSLEFLRQARGRFDMAVVSGSEQAELREVCRRRGIDGFFRAILGSPVDKAANLVRLLAEQGWPPGQCVYVGDAVSDRLAARAAGTAFVARRSGNVPWRDGQGFPVIDDLAGLNRALADMAAPPRP